MNKSRLLIAVVVLIGLSVAVGLTRRSHESQTKLEKPTTTLPTIKQEEVTAIEITKPGKPTIVLQKQNDKWRVTAPVNDDASKVDAESAVEHLAKLEITGIAASRKENHKRLEIDAEHAVRVKAKAGDKQLVDLLIGASKSGGTMVRVEGEDTVLAAKGSLRYVYDKEIRDFRNRDVTDFDAKELTALELSSAKGTFKFAREGDAWIQAQGEKPIAKFDPGKVSRLADALTSLRAVDFAEPTDSDAVTGLNAPMGRALLTKKDGSTIEILVGKQHSEGSEHFARASTSPNVYRITNFSSERMMPDAKTFEKAEPPPEGAGNANPPGLEGLPPMAGAENLPPELLQKLKDMQAGKMPPPH